jgi:hypothetical protein
MGRYGYARISTAGFCAQRAAVHEAILCKTLAQFGYQLNPGAVLRAWYAPDHRSVEHGMTRR